MQPKVILPDLLAKRGNGNGAASSVVTTGVDGAQYVQAEFSGHNESGFEPWGERVLILPDQPRAKYNDFLELPDDMKARLAYAAETGTIVAMGADAFMWTADRARRLEGEKPQVGMRIFYDRYSGGFIHGVDGRQYRVMEDRSVGALCTTIKPVVARAKK